MGVALGFAELIRPAEARDIPDLVRMAASFHAHADLGVSVDHAYLESSFRSMIASPAHLVLVLDGGSHVCGVFCAAVGRSPWAPVAVAVEQGMWIDPGQRGGMAVLRMMRRYVQWAQDMGCARAVMTALPGRSLDRLYARCGFEPDEINYMRRF